VKAVLVLLALLVVVPFAGASTRAPATRYVDDRYGPILATPSKQALYFWSAEKRAGGKIRCTGACARAWPPLVVRRASAVPRRVAGINGVFGAIRRPNGRLQVTYNRLPVYTYAHEGPEQVLCDDVGGWFVVRLR
jgi:predicted lipoprotein with Yx(FWY)xxD motif